jgi:hypothetical protein
MGRQAVVTLPEQVAGPDTGRLREQLLGLVDRSPFALITNLTATVSCDRRTPDALRELPDGRFGDLRKTNRSSPTPSTPNGGR